MPNEYLNGFEGIFKMPYELLNSKFDLTNTQLKFYLLLLHEYSIQKDNEFNVSQTLTKKIHIEFEIFKKTTNNESLYKPFGIKKFLEDMRIKKFCYKNKEKNTTGVCGFLTGYELYENKDMDLLIPTVVSDYFIDLQKAYSYIDIEDILKFKGTYTIRFYMLLMSFQNTGFITISTDDLRDLLCLSPNEVTSKTKYSDFGIMRTKVLNPSLDELQQSGLFEITTNEIRERRKIVRIEFKFKYLKKKKFEYYTKICKMINEMGNENE